MQQVEINESKKQYVAPQLAELGNISTITLGAVYGGGSQGCKFEQMVE